MAEFTLYTNPMSRGMIAQWALEEIGADYAAVLVPWDKKPAQLLELNPMGKVPTLVHHIANEDRVITEAAAICAYLSEVACPADLVPSESECAPFFRWLFFTAGPLEQAITARMFEFEPSAQQQGTVGYGSYERAVAALEDQLDNLDWICGDKFTLADVFVGAQVHWGLTFKTLPENETFAAYAERCRARPAFLRMQQAVDLQAKQIEAAAG